MDRSLLIAVRFHEGRYHGQQDRFNGADGWPPSPARLYQALLAGAVRGAQLAAVDESALRWLEHLPSPRIAAPAARRGRAVKLYVPNNDLDSVGGDPARVSKIRVSKAWVPCFFDPDEPLLYVWSFPDGAEDAARICVLARRLYQLGRGIDMACADGQILDSDKADALLESHPGTLRLPGGPGEIPTPCPGTLDSLVARYERKRRRLVTQGSGRTSGQLFRQPPKALFRHTGFDAPPRLLHFELRGTEERIRASAARFRGSVDQRLARCRGASAATVVSGKVGVVRAADRRPRCRTARSRSTPQTRARAVNRGSAHRPCDSTRRSRGSRGVPHPRG